MFAIKNQQCSTFLYVEVSAGTLVSISNPQSGLSRVRCINLLGIEIMFYLIWTTKILQKHSSIKKCDKS